MEKDNSDEGISKGSIRSRLQYVETAALLVLFAVAAGTIFTTRAVAQDADCERVAVNGEAETLSPPFLTNEDALKKWVEDTIRDAPPAGGMVTMLKSQNGRNDTPGKTYRRVTLAVLESHLVENPANEWKPVTTDPGIFGGW
jgi:hypothetical protein